MWLRALALGLAEPVWLEIVQAQWGWAVRPSQSWPGHLKWLRALVSRSAVARKPRNDRRRSDSNKRNLPARLSFESGKR